MVVMEELEQHLFQGLSGIRPLKTRWWVLSICIWLLCTEATHAEIKSMNSFTAIVNITFRDPETGQMRSERKDMGIYGLVSRLDSEQGIVVHVRSMDNQTHGCTPPVNVPKKEKWIALIERGNCKFQKKIFNAAVVSNASAVVIYNHQEGELLNMQHQGRQFVIADGDGDESSAVDDVVSIFMRKADGDKIARLVDNGTKVMMRISVGQQIDSQFSGINKTSILFVSISFIVLMIISLAWLVFYYIQRFRYAHAKERLSKRLMNAAKKAIGKMPVRTVRTGDTETDSEYDQCAVCIEGYKVSDVLRVLPCKHTFHKSCVDPWLIEQRSCPMCKMDILKAYGLQVSGVHGSCESVANIDLEGLSTSAGLSEPLNEGTPRTVTVLYAPPDLELHQTPSHVAMAAGSVEIISEGLPVNPSPQAKNSEEAARPPDSSSIDSANSDDLDNTAHERQALMAEEECTDGVATPSST